MEDLNYTTFSEYECDILLENCSNDLALKNIKNFIADIWQLNHSVGHSVRTIKRMELVK